MRRTEGACSQAGRPQRAIPGSPGGQGLCTLLQVFKERLAELSSSTADRPSRADVQRLVKAAQQQVLDAASEEASQRWQVSPPSGAQYGVF